MANLRTSAPSGAVGIPLEAKPLLGFGRKLLNDRQETVLEDQDVEQPAALETRDLDDVDRISGRARSRPPLESHRASRQEVGTCAAARSDCSSRLGWGMLLSV